MCVCEQREEVRSSQRLCNMVSEALHYLSHAYHAISDVMVDMGQEPPRALHASPVPNTTMLQPTAIIQQAIPIQVRMYLADHPHAGMHALSTPSPYRYTCT